MNPLLYSSAYRSGKEERRAEQMDEQSLTTVHATEITQQLPLSKTTVDSYESYSDS